MDADPLLSELRARVAEIDGRLVDAVGERLELVRRIREHKRETGTAFVDPDQERRLVDERQRANAGALSDAGVEELLRAVLDLTKRELER
jgi:chorismate mutase